MYCNTKAFCEKMDSGQHCLGPSITFSDPTVTESIAEFQLNVCIMNNYNNARPHRQHDTPI